MPLDPTLSLVPASSMAQREFGQIRLMSGDQQATHRFAEMGIRPGAQIQLIRHGKPCMIAVDGRKFSMRAEDLDEIFVQVSANSSEQHS